MMEECRNLNGCATGEAKITKGYKLHAKWVIHTVGPVWHGGKHNEDELLARCYRNSLALAAKHSVRTIAFPAISTGAYRFPIERAARIALTEIDRFLQRDSTLEKVIAVCFGKSDLQIYEAASRELVG